MAETGFVYQRSEGIQILKEEAETLLDYFGAAIGSGGGGGDGGDAVAAAAAAGSKGKMDWV
ncbi:hypothetical protein UVI_02012510 [Ustilaginoidea virens]|uniref:Uncharacterized protein n=1 Tax=Ustilaginoidea virens TaxID=1159556 RepID=A0A1B5KZU0_USTVR|nr:hypothetical protein UVI_02012510 [Ustilaginoidea virens]